MKVSDYIALYLEKRGVTHCFELIGGMITFMLDSLAQKTSVQVISMHHEQGAGFAAEGYGRMKGIPGVAMATSGPGATNLLTAIGSCYFDSVPVVFLTGQVNRHEQKGARNIRQLGFQETDIVSMAQPITKAAWLVSNPQDIPALLEKAFHLAVSGRPGPVLIDLPMDVQRAEIGDASRLGEGAVIHQTEEIPADLPKFISLLKESLRQAQHPLVLVGGGVRSPDTIKPVRDLLQQLQIPVVASLMGVDVLPFEHPLRVGLIGSYGNRWANIALSESDFLLVLGSRLDVRQTGADVASFKGERIVFHVDCEEGEMNNRVQGCHALKCELATFAKAAMACEITTQSNSWIERISTLRAQWPDVRELAEIKGINPNVFLHALSRASGISSAFVTDVGQHQMWAAQSLELASGQRFLTSGGMGAMGFALPCAIGASFAAGKQPVVVVAGDGGFQLNIQELQTIVRNKLPIKIVVLNNECHGMVRQFQESYFKGRYQSTVWGYSAPSFAAVAQAYGIAALQVTTPTDVTAALAALWEFADQPFLLEVSIPQGANAYPKMAFGRPISEMEPFAKPLEMEGT